MMRFAKITVFSTLLALILSISAFAEYKKPVKYPLGLRHGMNQEDAIAALENIDARIIENSERTIRAHYGKRYFGVIVEDINLHFDDDGLQSVTLRTNGEESDEKNNERLREFSNLIKAIYNVSERSKESTIEIDSTTDIKTRFVSRYDNGSYELLIYSYSVNDKYYLSLNFEKFF